MTQDEVYRHLFVLDHSGKETDPVNTRTTNYPLKIAELALYGVQSWFTNDVEKFSRMLTHPSLEKYAVDRMVVKEEYTLLYVFGVKLYCIKEN